MIGFDQGGGLRWSVPNYYAMIATADGGVIATSDGVSATIFDKNGSAVGQMAANAVPNWQGQLYVAGAGGLDLAYSWVSFGASFAAAAGGNPSGNGTSVLNIRLSEGLPVWSLFGGQPKCALGADKILLGGSPLQQYSDLKQKLLTFLGSLTPTSACEQFFNANPSLMLYYPLLKVAVKNQVPYDGLLSNLSMYDAGEWTQKDQEDVDAWPHFRTSPICRQFWSDWGDWGGTVAVAQVQPPSTDVYIATQKKALTYLTQSTILHESLHNLTGLGDVDLYYLLTGKKLPAGPTVVINTVLEQHGCVGAQ